MLSGKRLLITGVVTTDSIAFAVAERAQLAGAEIVLTALRPRPRPDACRRRRCCPTRPTSSSSTPTRARALRAARGRRARALGRLDGALHAIAFAPRDALGRRLPRGRPDGLERRVPDERVVAEPPRAGASRELAPPEGGVARRRSTSTPTAGAWPVYNWMGVVQGRAPGSTRTYLARDLGPHGIRVNLVAAGPLHTRAAGGIPDFERLIDAWERPAPLGWDPTTPAPVADAVCFLLSDRGPGDHRPRSCTSTAATTRWRRRCARPASRSSTIRAATMTDEAPHERSSRP